MLRDVGFTHVKGVDASDDAIRHCAEKGLGPVERGSICAIRSPTLRRIWFSPPT